MGENDPDWQEWKSNLTALRVMGTHIEEARQKIGTLKGLTDSVTKKPVDTTSFEKYLAKDEADYKELETQIDKQKGLLEGRYSAGSKGVTINPGTKLDLGNGIIVQ